MRVFLQILVFGITLSFYSLVANAQTYPQFSQYFASNIYMNPALSGLEHRVGISGLYRLQWFGITPYQIGLINAIIPYHDKGEKNYHKGGMGLNIWNARTPNGELNTLGASLNAAYNLHISATTAQNLTFGMQIGFLQKMFTNVAAQQWGSQYQPGLGFDPGLSRDANFTEQAYGKMVVPDITAGVLYYYNAGRDIYAPGMSAYIGVVGAHINQPNESVSGLTNEKIPLQIRVHGGLELHVAKRLNMSPNFLITTQQNVNFGIAGLNFTYLYPDQDDYLKPTRLVVGSSYRFGDAVVASLGFGSKYYNVGLSYDFGIGGLAAVSGKHVSAYEISFKTTMNISKKTTKSSKFHTPLM